MIGSIAYSSQIKNISNRKICIQVVECCEVVGEYFAEDAGVLKLALKKKVVEIETLKADIEDLRKQVEKLVLKNHSLEEVCNNFLSDTIHDGL